MDIEEIIETIAEKGMLSDILEDTMEIIKNYDKECYEEYLTKLYEIAYGKKLNRQMAEKIVSEMRPNHERWNYNEIERLQEEKGITEISTTEFYIIMNMAYNDYHNIFGEDIDGYIKFTMDFINDEDGKEDKVYKYFTM